MMPSQIISGKQNEMNKQTDIAIIGVGVTKFKPSNACNNSYFKLNSENFI